MLGFFSFSLFFCNKKNNENERMEGREIKKKREARGERRVREREEELPFGVSPRRIRGGVWVTGSGDSTERAQRVCPTGDSKEA